MPRPNYQTVHDAIKCGDAEELKKMVKSGASINEIDKVHKFTPLHWASYVGALECLHWLLWNGADPTVCTPQGWTPAHIAAIRGQDACMQSLINNGVSINSKDSRGSTATHLAAAHGNSFTLQALLRAGVTESVDNQGWTPVHTAAFHGRLGCLQFLLRWGLRSDDVDNHGNTAAHLAAMEGHLVVIKYLVAQAPSMTSVVASRNDDGETVKMLAQRFFKHDVVEYISHIEWERDCPEEAKSLAFPAHLAATNDDLAQLRALVENGAVNINERDEHGTTPLHKAAGQGNLKIIQWLIEMGANQEIQSDSGETAQDVARRFCQLAALKLLGGKEEEDHPIDDMADPPYGNTDGETLPLTEEQIKAAQRRAMKKIEELDKLLDIAKENYKQLGGKMSSKEKEKARQVRERNMLQQKRIEDLESQLEYERIRREKLEAALDEYKSELKRLVAELEFYHSLEEKERDTRKPRKRSTSRSNTQGSNTTKPPRPRSQSYNRNSDGVIVVKK